MIAKTFCLFFLPWGCRDPAAIASSVVSSSSLPSRLMAGKIHCKNTILEYKSEFPESEFSSLDSESETLLRNKSIPRPRPSLVQPYKTRPSPRLGLVLDRETRYFESESLIP